MDRSQKIQDRVDKPAILALIGARGGSKGLKNKNLLDFAGKPLIQWTIEAALRSEYIDDVVVSTDSEQIQSAALKAKARAPFLRPPELAADDSDINDAIVHAIEWLRANEGSQYDIVVLLQPTQPLRDVDLIDCLIAGYLGSGHNQRDPLVTVTRAEAKAAYLMRADGEFIDFALQKESLSSNRQEAPLYYYPAGALYIAPSRLS
ncbi:MAG: acylneuraminate cytidylyltransferase family protein [Leptospirales bacterium]